MRGVPNNFATGSYCNRSETSGDCRLARGLRRVGFPYRFRDIAAPDGGRTSGITLAANPRPWLPCPSVGRTLFLVLVHQWGTVVRDGEFHSHLARHGSSRA